MSVKFSTIYLLLITLLTSADVLEFEVNLTNKPIHATVKVTKGVVSPIADMKFSPDSKRLAVAGYKEVVIWSMEEAKIVKRFTNAKINGRVTKICFCGDEKLAIGSGEPATPGTLQLFDQKSRKVIFSFHQLKDSVTALACSKDGKFVAVGDTTGKLFILDTKTGEIVKELIDFKGEITGVEFAPNDLYFAASCRTGVLKIWEIDGWKPFSKMHFSGSFLGVNFVRGGSQIAVAIKDDKASGVKVESVRKGNPNKQHNIKKNGRFITTKSKLLDFAVTDRVSGLYMSDSDGTVSMTPWFNAFQTTTYKAHDDWAYSLALAPNELFVATGDAQGVIKIWNAVNRRLLATFIQQKSGDGSSVAVNSMGFFTGEKEMIKVINYEKNELSSKFYNLLYQPKRVSQSLVINPPTKNSKKDKKKSGRKRK